MLNMLKYMQFAALIGMVVLITLLANFNSIQYRLFAATAEGKLNTPPPVDQEIGDNVVNLWIADSMTKAMTMGFHDYQMRTLEIRPLFTDRGWESFMRFQRTSYGGQPAIRTQLENGHLIMYAQPRSPPQISEKGLAGGVFTYTVRAKLVVTRYGGTGQSGSDTESYEIQIERVKPEINPSGIAISQWRNIGGV